MSDFSLDVLQGYFDDLLTLAAPVAESRRVAVFADDVVTDVENAVTGVANAVTDVESRQVDTVIEDLARQKLARLLASQPVELAADLQPEPVLPTVIEATVAAEPAAAIVEADGWLDDGWLDNGWLDNGWLDNGWLDNGRPAWAQERFEVLLFEVAGLTLAVPLISLGQIQPLTDELTPLFGQADWFMGLLPTPAGQIRTINTARFVMPERYQDHFVDAAKYVISIDGLPWGLAVDAVNQPITLHPDDVKWRGERGKRPWLAGTVKQHMCALLDIQTMGRLLHQAEQTRSRTDPLKA